MLFTIGILCAIGSAVFNGSFAVLFKTDPMVRLAIHPMIFQLYVCLGILVSSNLVAVAMTAPFVFTGWGLVAGGLLVLAVCFSFFAIDQIGVALAQGIWGGTAMVVSYAWGVVIFQERPQKPWLSATGLVLLVMGVLGIALCETIAQDWIKPRQRGDYTRIPSSASSTQQQQQADNNHLSTTEATAAATNIDAAAPTTSLKSYALGVVYALLVGVFGGSILAPLHFVSDDKQGLLFLPSFGIGCGLVSPLVFAIYCSVQPMPLLHVRHALLTGLVSGLLWNTGNLLSILAIPILTYGVAYPIMQCAILISGLWGIYYFGEISDSTTIGVFWVGGATLVLGGGVLAVAQ